MKKFYIREIFTLCLISAFLTEALTSNVPLPQFFLPGTFIFLMLVGYGVPIVLIREVFIRYQLNFLGLFLLGIAYGFYNEGLLARTFFEMYQSPVAEMANYGIVGGVRVPWMIVISTWHACYAVVFPIIFTHHLFPQSAPTSWVGKKVGLGLFLFLSFAVISQFMKPASDLYPFVGTLAQLAFLLMSMLTLFILARIIGKEKNEVQEISPESTRTIERRGALIYVAMYFVPILMAFATIPSIFLIMYLLGVFVFFMRPTLLKLSYYPPRDITRVALFAEMACTTANLLFLAIFIRPGLVGMLQFFFFVVLFGVIIFIFKKRERVTQ